MWRIGDDRLGQTLLKRTINIIQGVGGLLEVVEPSRAFERLTGHGAFSELVDDMSSRARRNSYRSWMSLSESCVTR